MKNLVLRFVKNESGATAIEYGLIAALIGCGIIVAGSQDRPDLKELISRISTKHADTVV